MIVFREYLSPFLCIFENKCSPFFSILVQNFKNLNSSLFSPHVPLCIDSITVSFCSMFLNFSGYSTYSILQAAPHLSSVHHTTLSRKFSSNSGFEPSPAWVFYSPDNRGDDRSGAPCSGLHL